MENQLTPVQGVMEATSMEEFRQLVEQSTKNIEAQQAEKAPKQKTEYLVTVTE